MVTLNQIFFAHANVTICSYGKTSEFEEVSISFRNITQLRSLETLQKICKLREDVKEAIRAFAREARDDLKLYGLTQLEEFDLSEEEATSGYAQISSSNEKYACGVDGVDSSICDLVSAEFDYRMHAYTEESKTLQITVKYLFNACGNEHAKDDQNLLSYNWFKMSNEHVIALKLSGIIAALDAAIYDLQGLIDCYRNVDYII